MTRYLSQAGAKVKNVGIDLAIKLADMANSSSHNQAEGVDVLPSIPYR